MLTQLYIKDFAIVNGLDIEIDPGMTTITGETGAGKSISIDALSLCLGSRAETSMVRPNSDKTEICATFNVANIPEAINWLTEQDLLTQDQTDCMIRRVITAEGRSRAYINGAPVPAQLLKSLAPLLVNIHGQHAHQLLLKPEHQLTLLDQFAEHKHLLAQTTLAYQGWNKLKKELKKLEEEQANREARFQLLEYQVTELDEFAINQGEFEQIEQEHKKLSNSVALVTDSQQCYSLLYDNNEQTIMDMVQFIETKLTDLSKYDPALNSIIQMLNEAGIQLKEASYELRDYIDSQEPDPEKLQQLEERLTTALELARKHKVAPEELYLEHQKLAEELSQIKQSDEQSEQLKTEVVEAEKHYWQAADALSESRNEAAQTLSAAITDSMQTLNMKQGQFLVKLNQIQTPAKTGSDEIEFLVSANPGQPLQAMHKVASGGELSRISLALQVLTSSKSSVPTLIFDEVDVGISGPTAAIVGQMLRKIGESTQVICVTHLPQVAACGHQQMQVSKENDGQSTTTQMVKLSQQERIYELARLLGGDVITSNTLENAKDLLVS
ncbi:DNA repair protein RecN [Catenovulum sp. 2E275]|uniref:DNA repair protein RecN n=1 Tax=Catenovulum sp. 2E275 TaxID=2980497 RepID=UPI0021D37A33|nr:DNA repair protein RecN [Catenovulum sp. 2E275]MCU4674581.1 DNA repair protein RecN [Catenovulum sp. 2E275]